MEIGKKIRQLRVKCGLTQEQLADRLGLSAQAVSKWENAVAMPDITLLPELAGIFGVSIDELFDLTAEQKLLRIESRLDTEEDLEPDVFREYERFLKERIAEGVDRQRATSLLAYLYHHRLCTYARKTDACAREAIRLAPGKKDCQWLLQMAEGSSEWDWNVGNHSRTIDFYKEVLESDKGEPRSPLPYYYLIGELLADGRADEAEAYLEEYKRLPACRPFLIPTYEAAIALARFDEKKADAIMASALKADPKNADLLFQAAQYHARKCEYDQAIEYYEASYAAETDKKPRFTDALQGIATIYEIRGEYRKAADTHRRILAALREEWGFTEETLVTETEREIERLEKR